MTPQNEAPIEVKEITFEANAKVNNSQANFFTAIFASPKNASNLTLFVDLTQGLHEAKVNIFSPVSRLVLTSGGLAMLMVNHRGSIGMGDEALQAIYGQDPGALEAIDVMEAISNILQTSKKGQLNGKVIVSAYGYEAFVALKMAVKVSS